ncbi:hypothetical protein OAP32_00035 [Crocinitomicaceae bacterium]|nr:hypothetical protein [Crocinitomicaceae bacterium]
MYLPESESINTGKLKAVFNNTSASYKFYWFLSILDCIEQQKTTISKHELFARMIANAWYTVNYFKVSFGIQDKLHDTICFLAKHESIDLNESKEKIVDQLIKSKSKETKRALFHFDANVPHKFLSPWLGTGSRKHMYAQSQIDDKIAPYALLKNELILNEPWFKYITKNIGLIKDFCFWNLTLFLQSRNPSVPDIPNKLNRPESRGSLKKHKTKFWDIVIDAGDAPHQCIYTDKIIHIGDYAIEHFIPFNFLAHDLMWNLIPADQSFNSSKGAKLPPLDVYFEKFYALQKNALEIVKQKQPKNKFLQDYLTLFPELTINKERYRDHLEPLITIANNNGFEKMIIE